MNNHLNWQVDDLQELILTVFNPLLITLPISKIELYCTDGNLLLTRSDAVKLQPSTKTEISLKVRPREEYTISISHATLYLADDYFCTTVRFDSRGLNLQNTSIPVPTSDISIQPSNLKKPYLIDIQSIKVSKKHN